jgi:hypothetical protein
MAINMKKTVSILLPLILFLFCSSVSAGAGNLMLLKRASGKHTLLSSGSVSQANMRMSIVNTGTTSSGGAFVDFSSAGALTSYTNSKLTITDSAGKTLTGYIKAAGTGESYGTNPYATFDFTLWSNTGSTTIIDSNTFSVTAESNGVYKQTYSAGFLYKILVQGSGTSVTINDLKNDFSARNQICNLGSTGYYTGVSTSGWSGNLYIRSGIQTVDITSISSTQVLTPSVTGVTITSTKNGSLYNWTTEQSGFNRNATGYSYTIYNY